MRELFEEIRRRRLIEWMVAYVAGAILLLEIVDALASRWPITDSALRGVEVSVGIGFLLALVLAWHHGPRGRQEPSGPELLILTFLLLLASLLLALVVDEPFVAPEEGELGEVGMPMHPPMSRRAHPSERDPSVRAAGRWEIPRRV